MRRTIGTLMLLLLVGIGGGTAQAAPQRNAEDDANRQRIDSDMDAFNSQGGAFCEQFFPPGFAGRVDRFITPQEQAALDACVLGYFTLVHDLMERQRARAAGGPTRQRQMPVLQSVDTQLQ